MAQDMKGILRITRVKAMVGLYTQMEIFIKDLGLEIKLTDKVFMYRGNQESRYEGNWVADK